MSRSNADIVIHALEHWDKTGEVVEAAWSPELEYHTASDRPERTVYRGIDAYRSFITGWRDAFDDFHVEIEQVFERGDYVVLTVMLSGSLHGSGERVTMPESYLIKFRDGQAIELYEFQTADAAVAAIPATG